MTAVSSSNCFIISLKTVASVASQMKRCGDQFYPWERNKLVSDLFPGDDDALFNFIVIQMILYNVLILMCIVYSLKEIICRPNYVHCSFSHNRKMRSSYLLVIWKREVLRSFRFHFSIRNCIRVFLMCILAVECYVIFDTFLL